jgi:hypothetical protein
VTGRHPPEIGGSTAISSLSPTRIRSGASSSWVLLTHTREKASTSRKDGPYRAQALSMTSASVSPSTTSWESPAARRAAANNSRVATVRPDPGVPAGRSLLDVVDVDAVGHRSHPSGASRRRLSASRTAE